MKGIGKAKGRCGHRRETPGSKSPVSKFSPYKRGGEAEVSNGHSL